MRHKILTKNDLSILEVACLLYTNARNYLPCVLIVPPAFLNCEELMIATSSRQFMECWLMFTCMCVYDSHSHPSRLVCRVSCPIPFAGAVAAAKKWRGLDCTMLHSQIFERVADAHGNINSRRAINSHAYVSVYRAAGCLIKVWS